MHLILLSFIWFLCIISQLITYGSQSFAASWPVRMFPDPALTLEQYHNTLKPSLFCVRLVGKLWSCCLDCWDHKKRALYMIMIKNLTECSSHRVPIMLQPALQELVVSKQQCLKITPKSIVMHLWGSRRLFHTGGPEQLKARAPWVDSLTEESLS